MTKITTPKTLLCALIFPLIVACNSNEVNGAQDSNSPAAKTPAKAETLDDIAPTIQDHADKPAIAVSLYEQIRPHVQINNKTLSDDAIDAATRIYVQENYTPVLVENFKQVYEEMKKHNQSFSDCATPTVFNPTEQVPKALCKREQGNQITAEYLTKFQNKPLEKVLQFTFKRHANGIQMVDITMSSDQPAMYYVEGI